MKFLKSRKFKIFITILFIAMIIICNWSRIINLMLPAGSRPAEINFKVTRTTNSYSDIDISNVENKSNAFLFDLEKEGNWNITGTIETSDGEKGYFYIKSNATNK